MGTFLLSIVLIMAITVLFDLTEKLDKMMDNNAPLDKIIFKYYLNLLPFYFNMFNSLFVFISVIFFTSKLAGNSEIIAMQSCGMSFNRLLRPYLFCATIIAIFCFIFGSYIIPPANKVRLEFENEYIKKIKFTDKDNIQLEIKKGTILYIQNFDLNQKRGRNFSLEKYDGKTLTSRLIATTVRWDTLDRWHVENYTIREFKGKEEILTQGQHLDTLINLEPTDLFISTKEIPQMNNTELSAYIDRQRNRGVGNLTAFEDEYYKRFATPFAAFILTIMGASLSAKKVRGGTGANLGIGIILSAVYILFQTFSSSFSVNGSLHPLIAVWLPNFVFAIVAYIIYRKGPK